MAGPLRLLLIEDSDDDAALLMRELQRGGYDPTVQRVETPEAMKAALDSGPWDIVIADYVLPRFGALAALVMLRKLNLNLPFIIVSGSIGEGIAMAATKAGANAYVMKDDAGRLCAAIEAAMREGGVRQPQPAPGTGILAAPTL
jgi:DNA-binding response OmpR family regulator